MLMVPEKVLPFHNNPPVTLQYSPATPNLNENPDCAFSNFLIRFAAKKLLSLALNRFLLVSSFDREVIIIILLATLQVA